MRLTPYRETDIEAVVTLANLAFRGSGPEAGWNTEADILEGPRLTAALLRADLAARPAARLLTFRETENAQIDGTVWLEPGERGIWYLGLLTVHPGRQNQQLGRNILSAAEQFAQHHGARRIRMSVLNVRTTLIDWYVRRGYQLTGETQPFPYQDARFGKPLRDDLKFLFLAKDLLSQATVTD